MDIPIRTTLSLPSWIKNEVAAWPSSFSSRSEMMKLAIALAERNVTEKTGGPFGAAIFHRSSGSLISVGVNSVVRSKASIAHAEVMAIILAQRVLDSHQLSDCVLATSAQPCSQCTHTIWWSGIGELIIGARKEDVEKYTDFIEGVVPKNIEKFFNSRGTLPPIDVHLDILRRKACAPLRLYTEQGGENYGVKTSKDST